MRPAPPWLARLLVRALLSGEVRDWVLGDLDEAWAGWVGDQKKGRAARRWYWRQAVASVASVWMNGSARLVREMGGGGMMDWITGTRRAFRTLWRRPGFAVAVVATLGLGIGATTAVFSVVDGVLLRPLDLSDPDELAIIWRDQNGTMSNNSGPDLQDISEGVGAFESLYAFTRDRTVIEGPDGRRRQVEAMQVTSPILDVLEIRPALGRGFRPADQVEGGGGGVVIMHSLWQSAFGEDPDVIGRVLSIGGRATEVLGVLPEGATIPEAAGTQILMPFSRAIDSRGRSLVWLGAVARVRDGETIANARAQTQVLWEGLREAYPEAIQEDDIAVLPLQAYIVADVRRALLVLLGSTGFLMLMACVNAGGLLMVRGRGREGELAVRASIGASRGRLVREMLIEGGVLVALSGLAGVALATGGLEVLLRLAPADLPRLDVVGIDGRVLSITMGVSAAVGLLTVLIPAFRVAAVAPGGVITGEARGGVSSRGAKRRRSLMIGAQAAVAVVLLAGAGLMLRSLSTLLAVDPGYRIDNVVTARVELPGTEYADRDSRVAAFEAIEAHALGLPGVTAAGFALMQPMQEGRINFEVAIDGLPAGDPSDTPVADLMIASGGWFEALDIQPTRGRLFNSDDRPDGPWVVIASESLAQELWPEQNPIGRTIGFLNGDEREPAVWREVVGVVPDVHFQSLDDQARGTLYVSNSQLAQFNGVLLTHVEGDAAPVVEALRSGLPGLVAGIAEPDVSTLRAARRTTLAQDRFRAVLLASFAGLALLLAGVGIYGTIAYSVGQRRREIGLRLALGARPESVVSSVLRQGMVPVAIGVVGGVGLTLLAGRSLEALLFEVSARDPFAIAGAGAALALVALIASFVPAARAARQDPSESLREE